MNRKKRYHRSMIKYNGRMAMEHLFKGHYDTAFMYYHKYTELTALWAVFRAIKKEEEQDKNGRIR